MSKVIISSSVANFRDKILAKNIQWPGTLFIGLYHWKDYWRFLFTKEPQTVLWCGSDILALEKSWWRHIVRLVPAEHLCENEVEQAKLQELGIQAEIHPTFFDDVNKFPVSYSWLSKTHLGTHVWMCVHPGREKEYGLLQLAEAIQVIDNLYVHVYGDCEDRRFTRRMIYHGEVPEAQLNEEIKGYHAGIRLNEFDGFSEVTAKSILLGQWPITRIKYEKVAQAKTIGELIDLLEDLKKKKKPNLAAREYWLPKIKEF